MWKIKGLDNRPVRIEPSLEDIQSHARDILRQVEEIKEREIQKGTPQEVIEKVIESRRVEIKETLDKEEEFYKEEAKEYISKRSLSLQWDIFSMNERENKNPWVIGEILTLFLKWVLDIIQEVEIMEWTPKNTEICSRIEHSIYHVPVWENLLRTNNQVHQILLYASLLLAQRMEQRKQIWEDERLGAQFIHNPEDKAPEQIDTKYLYIEYGNDMNPDAGMAVTFRQVLTLVKPKNQTPYNLELFEYTRKEIRKVFEYIEEIIQSYK